MGPSCFKNGERLREFGTYPVFKGILMQSIPTLISGTELFIQRISSVSTEQPQNGVKRSQEKSLGREVILDTKVFEARRGK